MNLLFDLDGTLTDPAEGITRCLAYALEQLGRPAPPADQLRTYIGPPLITSLGQLLASDDPSLLRDGIRHYRERFASVGLYENRLHHQLVPVLDRLNASGHRLWVATSKPQIYAVQIVRHFELTARFEKVYGSELTGERVEKTDLLAWLLAQERLPPAETVMVGDRVHDVVGARAHDLRVVGVLWGFGSQTELSCADATVATAVELLDQIESWAANPEAT